MGDLNHKLSSSRLLKLVLIGIISLLGIKLIFFGFSIWITTLISNEINDVKITSYLKILEALNVSISGAIATIITAAIARYGIREATKNLTLPNNFANTHDPINNEGGK